MNSSNDHISAIGCLDEVIKLLTFKKSDLDKDVETEDIYYSSSILLYNVESEEYTPLFLFEHKLINDKDITSDKKIVNPLARIALNSVAIDLISILQKEDDKIKEALDRALEKAKILNRYKTIEKEIKYDRKVALACRIYDFLNSYMKENDIKRLSTLFKGIAMSKDEYSNVNSAFLSLFDTAIETLKKNGSSKIAYSEKEILLYLVFRCIAQAIKEKKNVLFVTSNDNKEELIDALNDISYCGEAFDLSSIYSLDISALEKEREQLSFDSSYQLLKKRYISFYQKREEIFDYPKFIKIDDIISSLTDAIDDRVKPVLLPITEYKKDDYLKDITVIDLFKREHIVPFSFLNTTLFIQKDLSGDVNEYELFKGYVKTIEEESIIVLECEKRIEDGCDIQIKDASSYKAYRELLKKLKEFIAVDKGMIQVSGLPLDRLLSCYEMLSTRKMMVLQFFKQEILDKTYKEIIDQFQSGQMKNKRNAIKVLKRYVIDKENKDYLSLVDILSDYIKEEEGLKDVITTYFRAYGQIVFSVSKVKDSIKAFSLKEEIEEYKMKSKEFDTFINRYLKEKDYRDVVDTSFKEISPHIVKVVKVINLLYTRFGCKDDLRDMNVKDLLPYISTYKDISYDQYRSAVIYQKGIQEASIALNEYFSMDKKEDIFSGFLSSLLLSYVAKFEEDFALYKDAYDDIQNQLKQALKDVLAIYSQQLISDTVAIERGEMDESYHMICKFLSDEREENKIMHSEELIELLSKRYLFHIASERDIALLDDKYYDVVILINSWGFDNLDLLNCYRVGRKVLIINDRSNYDLRTQFYDDTYITKKIVKTQFIRDDIDIDGISNLVERCEEKGILKKDERETIIPFIQVKNTIEIDDCISYAEFINLCEGKELEQVDIIDKVLSQFTFNSHKP